MKHKATRNKWTPVSPHMDFMDDPRKVLRVRFQDTLPPEMLHGWALMDEYGGVPRTRKMISWNMHCHSEDLEFEVNHHGIETIYFNKKGGETYKVVYPNHLKDE